VELLKYKYLVQGIEKADSVVIDCHKMLMTPALTTALLFKNGQTSYQTFVQKAQYFWSDAEEREWYNYSKRTFECTKLMMSIKFYALIRTYGVQALEDFVTTLYDLGKTFAKMIQSKPHFELAVEPMANILCFRWLEKEYTDEKLNQLNANIRKHILEKGEFYIVQTKLKDKLYLRTTLMNPFTTEAELEKLLEEIEKIAKEE
jgi:L-2,4-diaminobutyrate decarboxylase